MKDSFEEERLLKLKEEFSALLEFHAAAFVELDEKARHWITLSIPILLASSGYLINNFSQISAFLAATTVSLCVGLIVSTWYFTKVIRAAHVMSGFYTPQSADAILIKEAINDPNVWSSISFSQVEERLCAIKHNEEINREKSNYLKKAEFSLFRVTPCSIATATAFYYAAAAPSLNTTTTASAIEHFNLTGLAGLLIGALGGVTAITIAFLARHDILSQKLFGH